MSPVTITGPDNREYQFPDGTDKTAAIAYFKKKGIGAAPSATFQAGTNPTHGFFERLGQAVGVPTSQEELQSATAKPSVGSIALGPAYDVAKSYATGLGREAKNVWQESREAGENIGQGQPIGPNLGKVGSALIEAALRGVLAPVGGNIVQTGGEDVATKNYAGAGGDILGAVINALLFKGVGGPSDATRVAKLTYATGADASTIEKTLGDVVKTARNSGHPPTVGGLLETTKTAKNNMNAESGAAMLPIASAKTVPTAVADRIRSLITPNMKMTAAGRREIAQINAAAVEFEKPWSYRELDAERMAARKRLKTFSDKNPVQQYAAKGANRTTAIDDAINKAVKDTVYPAMDRAAGKPAGYFANMKGRQSALIDLEDTLHDRVEKLKTETAKIKGAPRFSRATVRGNIGETGSPRLWLSNILSAVHTPNPAGTANSAVKSALSQGSATHALVLGLPIKALLMPPSSAPLPPNHPLAQAPIQ